MTDSASPVPPPSGPAQPPMPGFTLPPIDVKLLVDRFVAVLTKPAEFYASIRGERGLGPPLVFSAAVGVVAGVLGALYGLLHLGAPGLGVFAALFQILLTPVFHVLFGSFVGGAVVHAVATVAGGKGSYEDSVKVASYATAVNAVTALLAFIPLLSVLPGLYGMYVAALGIVAIHGADRRRTFTLVGVLAAVLLILTLGSLLTVGAALRP